MFGVESFNVLYTRTVLLYHVEMAQNIPTTDVLREIRYIILIPTI